MPGDIRAAVLVEGDSDRLAVTALARRRGRDLEADGILVVAIGGSKNAPRFAQRFGPAGMDVRLAGLCDAAEERDFARAVEIAGLGAAPDRAEMARLRFHVCVADLEDELIRALGPDGTEHVVDREGELASFRIFQRQPQWRDRPASEQLRRFLGTYSGRKIHMAPALVEALDLERMPRPLADLLASL